MNLLLKTQDLSCVFLILLLKVYFKCNLDLQSVFLTTIPDSDVLSLFNVILGEDIDVISIVFNVYIVR